MVAYVLFDPNWRILLNVMCFPVSTLALLVLSVAKKVVMSFQQGTTEADCGTSRVHLYLHNILDGHIALEVGCS